ncbi:MAG: N-acetyltransferase [Veillonellaceae bacterium]|jgi:amino-acid N-acetyltransferase|uniref:N-acetyltransferase n=1 Tax=uncultured Selenomonas sp. TaxID=159275 RepID=UPI0025EEE6F1|nr:N-acetyltransferase [uncultured Selenomonas sp.]MCI6100085.1 N-acetyltransferase [Selenomonas sp.]MCI7539815.1 N-acetyltransferase [Veillonellaceae bacterium]MDD6127370.1 N-acetyltransferase [Veillonellaceae bacterium]MDD6698489.1 N-acetyltransferase [Veillonellaceae bacterium]MDY6351102.1 N-acetyltransferase [Selenomonas sp.]
MIYRKATFDDIEQIFAIVNDYASDGVMLARSRNTLYETLRDMVVAEDEQGTIVGVGGLHILWDRLAEIRTMAVSPRLTRRGIGAEIVKRLLEEGRKIGVTKFFTLTYKPGFFQTLGFHTVTKETLPPKVWKDCIDCPKFPNCDEIALIREEEGEAPALPKGF